MTARKADHPIADFILNRWSPRSFTNATISQAELETLFEAARWAPSSYNSQPWRFVYALRGGKGWDALTGLLNPFNQSWATHASALVFLISKKTMMVPTSADPVPSRSHSLDAGAAWGMLALQAQINGWSTHAMVGLDFDKAVEVLHVPDGYAVEMAFVVGKAGPKEQLPEALQAREVPSSRLAVSEFASEAVFKA